MTMAPSPAPLRIDVWSDVACPWCLLGNAHLRAALERTGTAAEVQMRSYQLAPIHGSPQPVRAYLAKVYGDSERIQASQDRLEAMGADVGLTYDFEHALAVNTFDAHRLHHLGRSKGLGAKVMDLLLRAQHTAGEDVSDEGTLRRIGLEAGLETEHLDALFSSQAFAEDVRQEIAQARSMGVQGVPFFLFEGRLGVSGAQPVEVFEQAIRQSQDLIAASAADASA